VETAFAKMLASSRFLKQCGVVTNVSVAQVLEMIDILVGFFEGKLPARTAACGE